MSAAHACIPDPPATSGLYRRMSNAVRSRIPLSTTMLYRSQSGSRLQPARSRSSSTSSGSTEEIGRETRPRTRQADSDQLTNGRRTPSALQRATQCPNQSSMNLEAAEIGYGLCASARRHAYSHAPDEALLRAMLVDAIYYLSKALPKDLTPTEVDKLRKATPPAILERQENTSASKCKPTALRRITAWSTTCILSWIFLLVPLMVAVLNSALLYERQHHLTERGLSYFQETYVSVSGRLGGYQMDTAARGNGNALGRFVGCSLLWLADISGEVMSGAGEGWKRAVASGHVVDDQAEQGLRE